MMNLVPDDYETAKKKFENICGERDHIELAKAYVTKHGGKIVQDTERSTVPQCGRRGDLLTLKFLLQAGASIDTVDMYGWNALHYAAYHDRFNTFKTLWDQYPALRVKLTGDAIGFFNAGNGLETVLHIASRGGAKRILEFLLAQNFFDINVTDRNKRTPLHWALHAGGEKCGELLLQNGANHLATNKEGLTPFQDTTHYDIAVRLSSLVEKKEVADTAPKARL